MDSRSVESKLAYMEEELAAVREQAAAYHSLLAASTDPQGALRAALLRGLKYSLQTTIQAMIDVAYHIAAKDFRHAAHDAYDAFACLERGGVTPGARGPVYRRMIGFRNVLVHGYAQVDAERVLAFAADRSDFDGFRREVLTYAERQRSGGNARQQG